MWISKKKWKELEKRVNDLEKEVGLKKTGMSFESNNISVETVTRQIQERLTKEFSETRC